MIIVPALASSHAEHSHSLLAFISAGIPLLVLVPISTLIARNKWDVHNSVIGE
jgi:diacylglycerol diphosphate phosphatase/phosphatidate phosphatase